MKKYFILILFACILFSANSQQLKLDWLNQAGGSGWDVVTDVTELNNGQIAITGAYYDTIAFQNQKLVSNGSRDIYLAIYNADGKFNRAISIGGEGYDYVKKIKPFGKSGLVLPIRFNREVVVGSLKFKGKHLNNILLTWLDNDLNPANYILMGSNSQFDITSLETAEDGDFYFSGWFSDTLNINNKEYIASDAEDAFIGKISSNGNIKWFKNYGNTGKDKVFSLFPDNQKSNFLIGTTSNGCFDQEISPKVESDNSDNLFLAGIDDNGKEFEVDYPLHGLNIEPVDVIKDSTSVWILTNFRYSLTLRNGVEINSFGKSDVLILKYNLEEHSVKYCQMGGFGNEEASGFELSGDQISVTGLFTYKFVFGKKEIVAEGYETDVFIATLDKNCNPVDIISVSGDGSEFPCSLIASESGVFIAGEFNGVLKTDLGEFKSKGKEDIFLVRIENCNAKNPLNVTTKPLDLITSNDSWELDAGTGFVSYSWDNSKSGSRYFTVSESGTYSVEVTDSLGCVYSRTINIDAEKSAKIEKDVKPEHNFRIYPSITSDLVYWEPSDSWLQSTILLRVIDIAGKEVLRTDIDKLQQTTYKIDLSHQGEGAYIVEISGEGFSKSSKVIVKR